MGNCYLIKNGGFYLTPEEIEQIKSFSWQPNSIEDDGYVLATQGAANKVWKTDESGVPAWRDEATGGGETAGSVNWENVQNKPKEFKPEPHTHTISDITDFEETLNSKGYQTSDDVEEILSGKDFQTSHDVELVLEEKGYQNAEQVDTAITGKGYQTSEDVEAAITQKGYQTAVEVQQAISKAEHLKRTKVDSLPGIEEADTTTIYMVPIPGAEGQNKYTEWMVMEGAWEQIGNSDVDLTDYVKTEQLTETLQNYAQISQLDNYIPITEKDNFVTQEDIVNFITEEDLTPYAKEESISQEYATKNELEKKANKSIDLTAIIPTKGWSGEGIQKVTVEVEGILSTDAPIIDVSLTGESETDLEILKQWAFITRITTSDDSITIEAIQAPTQEIPINIKIVR